MPRQFYVKGKRILVYARPEGDRRGVAARAAAEGVEGSAVWSDETVAVLREVLRDLRA